MMEHNLKAGTCEVSVEINHVFCVIDKKLHRIALIQSYYSLPQ